MHCMNGGYATLWVHASTTAVILLSMSHYILQWCELTLTITVMFLAHKYYVFLTQEQGSNLTTVETLDSQGALVLLIVSLILAHHT